MAIPASQPPVILAAAGIQSPSSRPTCCRSAGMVLVGRLPVNPVRLGYYENRPFSSSCVAWTRPWQFPPLNPPSSSPQRGSRALPPVQPVAGPREWSWRDVSPSYRRVLTTMKIGRFHLDVWPGQGHGNSRLSTPRHPRRSGDPEPFLPSNLLPVRGNGPGGTSARQPGASWLL